MMKSRALSVFILFLTLSAGFVFADENPFLVGEYKVTRVIDGDTIAVDGLNDTIRFLCIDTEESEKGNGAEQRTAAIAQDYLSYVKKQLREDPMLKFNTPIGWEATQFAQKWFPIGSPVRVEYDSLARKTGSFGRVLGYVFVKRNDEWINYNIECVRAGMSPYYDKYGASERFEPAFIAAEREARIHQRGIWSPYAMCYPNYDDRLVWWSQRANAMKRFEKKYGSQPNAISIMDEDDWDRLKDLKGKEVLLFSSVGDLIKDAPPLILELQHKQFIRFAIVVPDQAVFNALENKYRSNPDELFYLKGILKEGFDRGTRDYVYSLQIDSPEQCFIETPESIPGPASPIQKIKLSGDEISWEDAPKHQGKDVVVVGRIVRTKNIGNITFLNFDPNFKETLTVVIMKENYSKFSEPAETLYKDRAIRIRGKITEHQGSPQIVIEGPEQVDILE